MCSQSVSGSSLLSGYDEDDARETSGRSRREFDQIDSVLYGEELPKRSSIKKICEEWSSKPHFRVRGSKCPIDRQQDINRYDTTANSSLLFEQSSTNLKMSSINFNEINVLGDDITSGRSSIDSIEGSELTNNSELEDDDDLDDADATNTCLGDRFSNGAIDPFDTDEDDDDDDNGDCSSNLSRRGRTKHPQDSIKCLKDSIIISLASSLFQHFLNDQQFLLQRYTKEVCAKNSIVLRRKLRPSSLPPRSLSQNRLSLQIGSSTNTSLQQQSYQMSIASLPFRSTPEPNIKLNSLLRVTPLRTTNPIPITSNLNSPRKSQVSALQMERTSTSVTLEKRNQQQQQQQISLVGTAVGNLSLQISLSTSQPSQTQILRQPQSMWRYRSATTLNSNIQNSEPITRLPPITIERLMGNEQLMNNRSNTITAAIVDSMPPATRAVSGASTGSNASATVKARTSANLSKIQRTSRPLTIASSKELNNFTLTSPTRSITTTTIPSTALRTTAIGRTHQQQQKRPLLTTKPPAPPPSTGTIKVSATRIC
ncbi:unnamed protein product [Adineta steineri]|uniref:Uncharacterized protein n=1 Tax=Adineta steineri TaxID=433720 RepID=A0A815MQL5_9BILA|nr:unnamed protein product [Adineta steineri]CAF1620281.1 unnamed protein product [Adineta steineri]